jgi:hypothetical protein
MARKGVCFASCLTLAVVILWQYSKPVAVALTLGIRCSPVHCPGLLCGGRPGGDYGPDFD